MGKIANNLCQGAVKCKLNKTQRLEVPIHIWPEFLCGSIQSALNTCTERYCGGRTPALARCSAPPHPAKSSPASWGFLIFLTHKAWHSLFGLHGLASFWLTLPLPNLTASHTLQLTHNTMWSTLLVCVPWLWFPPCKAA